MDFERASSKRNGASHQTVRIRHEKFKRRKLHNFGHLSSLCTLSLSFSHVGRRSSSGTCNKTTPREVFLHFARILQRKKLANVLRHYFLQDFQFSEAPKEQHQVNRSSHHIVPRTLACSGIAVHISRVPSLRPFVER
jgi:hypothetical protein